ncbi:hypothetical protein CYMTET_42247 [Cymbomonas tetramitiformis]|uniref:Uncharacterized protein n=2 Tax=Cymbomonas tetramitiformis TaxID=36881 RepID=A0AAE0C5S6_9CHLO|nr:hypothetical protein CYMTET_42247 [Cymbomonas tetramitiformis]
MNKMLHQPSVSEYSEFKQLSMFEKYLTDLEAGVQVAYGAECVILKMAQVQSKASLAKVDDDCKVDDDYLIRQLKLCPALKRAPDLGRKLVLCRAVERAKVCAAAILIQRSWRGCL